MDTNKVWGVFPLDEEIVQVTYKGYNDNKLYCDEFAYRLDGGWFWSHDDDNVRAEITAWRRNSSPYIK